MLIELLEHDNTSTIIFVRTSTSAIDLINFCKNTIMINASVIEETGEVRKQLGSSQNDQRAQRYLKEYNDFNEKHIAH